MVNQVENEKHVASSGESEATTMNTIFQGNKALMSSVSRKVYLLRKHHGISQEALAEYMKVNKNRVIRAERGEEEYNEEHRAAIKECFRIVEFPLTDWECYTFRERLYYWRDLIRAKRIDEAREIHKEMKNINNLEICDPEMVMLCRMMEVKLLMAEGDIASATDKLNIPQERVDEMNDENRFHYWYNKGALYAYQGSYEKALELLLKADKLIRDNEVLIYDDDGAFYYNIAMCYTCVEIPHHAISYWQRARQEYPNKRTTKFILRVDQGLALNYIKMNQLEDADKLLNKCLIMTESIKGENFLSHTLFCFGYMHKKAENWDTAIKYFDKSLSCITKDSIDYYPSVYHKIQCIIHTRAFTKARKLLEQVKDICKADEVWAVCFEALGHYLKISSNMTSYKHDEAVEYIENVAIPHFIKMHDYINAVEYYSLLEKYYERVKNIKKSLLMAKAILNIYTRCYVNLEGEI